jgi:NADH-quinone oxidoreductase subunit I
MYGLGIARGLWTVFKHFLDTYTDDLRWLGRRYYNPEALAVRQGPQAAGIFTVQYPEEKLITPEEFRYIPFLLYEVKPDGSFEDRCTSCGICAKTGRPIPAPREFYIDIDICMNCGFCAEYCPFDAIKMDHDFELSSFDRTSAHIFNKEKLSKPVDYYASIRPTNYAREEVVRAEKEAKKAKR